MEAEGSNTASPNIRAGGGLQLSAAEYQQHQQQRQQQKEASVSAQQTPLFSGPDAINFQPSPHDDGDASSKNYDNDPKRRRIARACDQCRKKKIKCDGKTPACSHCQNYSTECVFTLVEKKRQPPKGAKYIEGLENRLGRMESLLKLSGILPEFDSKTDLGALERKLEAQRSGSITGFSSPGNALLSRPVSANGTPNSCGIIYGSSPSDEGKEPEEETESLSNKMSSLVTNARGETRFIGSSSGFSIFSPKGIQWVNSKTGSKDFETMLKKMMEEPDHKFDNWKPDVWDDLFANRYQHSIPSKAEAVSYVNDYFRSLNILFPLFHQQTFESLLEQQYSDNPPKGSGWYAAFNMVMAIGCRLRSATSKSFSQHENARGWKFFRNAISLYPALALQNADILSVQALLAMPLFLQGTSNPQPLYNIISTAIRVAFSIGLHTSAHAFGFSREESEQRKRVFWVAYMIDKDISLRSGRPSCINDDDINVELPEEDSFDGLGMIELTGGRGRVNLFRRNCTFARIQSRVYMHLYSAKATKQSDGELLNTIGNLDRELEEWRDSIPLDFRPEHEISDAYEATALPLVIMHFGYFNCLTTIHRMSIAHSFWTNRLAQYAVSGLNSKPLNPRVFSSAALSVSAARSSIHLLKYINQDDTSCLWLVFYYPVTALLTLFANILQNPQDANAKTDVKLMGVVVEFLAKLDQQERDSSGFDKLIQIVREFDRLARSAIEKAEKETLIRRKRKKPTGGSGKPKDSNEDARISPDNDLLQVPSGDSMSWSLLGTPSEVVSPRGPGVDKVMGTPPKNPVNHQQQHTTPNGGLTGIDEFGFSYETPGQSSQMSEDNELSPLTKSFQESFSSPFVPQSMWNLNQTFEWDWANFGLLGNGNVTGNTGGLAFGDEQGANANGSNDNSINWDGVNFF